MPKLSEIGDRLREFGQSKYESMAKFARAIEVSASQLNDYLAGRRIPGNKMQSRLRDLGCDIEWLMTGNTGANKKKKKIDEAVLHFHAPPGMSPEVKKKIQKLIEDISELEEGDIDRARALVRAAFRKK